MKHIYLVYPDKIGTIAPEIYGHFTEHIGGVFYDGLWVGRDSKIPNINGFRKDLIEKLKEIRPSVLRWPGGCFAETYNWRDGIGENRPVRPGWWTPNDGRYESNEVGTHEFMELCELVGAKAYFAMNVTSITPMQARDWMDYCMSPRGSTTLALEREKNGHPEPFDIAYWGVGNENWGGGGNMTADYYALEYRRFATVMYNICDKKSELIAGGANGGDYAWTHDLVANLEKTSAPVHGMSFHFYTGNAKDALNFDEDEWYSVLAKCCTMDERIRRHHSYSVGKKMEDKLKLVVDEWGCWYPEGSGPSKGYNLFEQQSTMRDALVSALTLNIFNNQCDKVRMANVAQLCNNLHCLFLAGGEHCITTPTYHVFKMFRDHQGAEAIRAFGEDNDDIKKRVSVSASVKDGIMTVTLANCSCEEDTEISLDLFGIQAEGTAEVELLTSGDIHDYNTFDAPDTVAPTACTWDITKPVTMPRASVATVRIKLK